MAKIITNKDGQPEFTKVVSESFIEEIIKETNALIYALQHIAEYWNRDQNEQAMNDALWHIIETAEKAIARAKGE